MLSEETVAPETANPKAWSPTSWKEFPIKQHPEYADLQEREAAYEKLRKYPPLVTCWEIKALQRKLADVGAGRSFLLQGGDCAERFQDCTSPIIVNLLKVMLQMSFILIHELDKPVVRIGRIAGQYAKPRSNNFEIVDGQKIHKDRK